MYSGIGYEINYLLELKQELWGKNFKNILQKIEACSRLGSNNKAKNKEVKDKTKGSF